MSGSTDADNTITVEITASMLNNSDVTIGENYWFGAAVEVDSKTIWSVQKQVTAASEACGNVSY